MQIEIAKKEDLAEIRQIWNYYIEHTTINFDYQAKTMGEVEHWFDLKQKQALPVLVVKIDNNVVGYASYGIFRPWEGFKFSIEHGLYLKENVQGKGIGRHLLESLLNHAQNQGFVTSIAVITADNMASIKFHEHVGFKKIAYLEKIGYKFEQWLDCIYMQKML